VLKTELHSHSSDDPHDLIPYDTFQLIETAASQGYQALAITLHDRQLDLEPYSTFAQARGVTLVPGIERTIDGRHVLLLNFPAAGAEAVRSFADVRRLKAASRGLVIAPHPFFPSSTCLRSLIGRHADLFDAVEYNGMFTRSLNFNLAAERWAAERGLPMVGNGDVHRLSQLGTTWSMVDAAPHPDAICEAIRAGRVTVQATPHTAVTAGAIFGDMLAAHVRRKVLGHPAPAPQPSASGSGPSSDRKRVSATQL
jgi:hypothetical protein